MHQNAVYVGTLGGDDVAPKSPFAFLSDYGVLGARAYS
jgi:hypothetical protein